MKNIHVLPTETPSRLQKNKRNKLFLSEESKSYSDCNNQNIYITNDEEIKIDDYYLGDDNYIYCLVSTVNYNGKKIILTTDQRLIKDGVQAIDDEFLKWFVKTDLLNMGRPNLDDAFSWFSGRLLAKNKEIEHWENKAKEHFENRSEGEASNASLRRKVHNLEAELKAADEVIKHAYCASISFLVALEHYKSLSL